MRTLFVLAALAALSSAADRDWPAYGGGPAGIRYSDLKQIDRNNVKQLTVAWSYDTADGAGDPQTQPILVDGVLYGNLERYREREGLDYAAASPASVAFVLKFVDMQTKQVVWTAKFAKAQKALSQNVFELANFVQHQARWVRAHEIAQDVHIAV